MSFLARSRLFQVVPRFRKDGFFYRFVFQYFVFIRVFDFPKHSITFASACQLNCWFTVLTILNQSYIKSVTRFLLIEILYNFRTITYWSTLYLHVCLRFLYFPSSFVSPFESNDWEIGDILKCSWERAAPLTFTGIANNQYVKLLLGM